MVLILITFFTELTDHDYCFKEQHLRTELFEHQPEVTICRAEVPECQPELLEIDINSELEDDTPLTVSDSCGEVTSDGGRVFEDDVTNSNTSELPNIGEDGGHASIGAMGN